MPFSPWGVVLRDVVRVGTGDFAAVLPVRGFLAAVFLPTTCLTLPFAAVAFLARAFLTSVADAGVALRTVFDVEPFAVVLVVLVVFALSGTALRVAGALTARLDVDLPAAFPVDLGLAAVFRAGLLLGLDFLLLLPAFAVDFLVVAFFLVNVLYNLPNSPAGSSSRFVY